MTRGDVVILLADPLGYGLGCVAAVCKDGRLMVQWPDTSVSDHDPHELQDADEWERAQVSSIPDDAVARILAGTYDAR